MMDHTNCEHPRTSHARALCREAHGHVARRMSRVAPTIADVPARVQRLVEIARGGGLEVRTTEDEYGVAFTIHDRLLVNTVKMLARPC